ncbi:MAG: hypothetical protein ACI9MR_002797 [Myxococcota bacterium]|jgi:uncharacterized protein (DUF2237 family)
MSDGDEVNEDPRLALPKWRNACLDGRMKAPLSVLGTPLQSCSLDPLTGWFRDGCCNTDDADRGSHTVCATLTRDFLEYLRDKGNDLITPRPEHGFKGLAPGDSWCVCAASWRQAHEAGLGCPVKLESTHAAALSIVSLSALMEHAIAAEA